MTEQERLSAIEAIRNLKAKYWRGIDNADGEMVRSILAEDCVLDYRGCGTDPATGVDYMPQMNIIMKGRSSWPTANAGGPVTVHQGHQAEIEVDEQGASAIWSFSDRLFMPPGSPFARLTGYGHYHETYEQADGAWLLKTTRITRLWVEVS